MKRHFRFRQIVHKQTSLYLFLHVEEKVEYVKSFSFFPNLKCVKIYGANRFEKKQESNFFSMENNKYFALKAFSAEISVCFFAINTSRCAFSEM